MTDRVDRWELLAEQYIDEHDKASHWHPFTVPEKQAIKMLAHWLYWQVEGESSTGKRIASLIKEVLP